MFFFSIRLQRKEALMSRVPARVMQIVYRKEPFMMSPTSVHLQELGENRVMLLMPNPVQK
jgi:hypothetical protein